jgi:hypothetical protein
MLAIPQPCKPVRGRGRRGVQRCKRTVRRRAMKNGSRLEVADVRMSGRQAGRKG